MLGTLVNAAAIAAGALLGVFVIRGAGARFEETVKKALGLAVIFTGIKGALENERPLLLIMSMTLGAVLGELAGIDRLMNRAGNWAQRIFSRSPPGEGTGGASFSRAFVTASVLFCSGSMAIVGSMQSGLTGNHETLFTKSMLDGTFALVFGASLGIGTAFSALPVLFYQGGITAAAMALRDFLSADMIREMSAAGSLVIAAIGFNFLSVKEIKVANLIPAVFIPLVYLAGERIIKG
jgi:uncharacterized membrane protein YqgA involved in biofilm formation